MNEVKDDPSLVRAIDRQVDDDLARRRGVIPRKTPPSPVQAGRVIQPTKLQITTIMMAIDRRIPTSPMVVTLSMVNAQDSWGKCPNCQAFKSATLDTPGNHTAIRPAVPLYYRAATATPASIATAPSIIPIALSYSDIDPAGTNTDAHLRERGGKGAEHKCDRS